MRHERLTQPSAEPLSLTELQLWIPGADAGWLTDMVPLARDFLEQELQRLIAPSSWAVWLDRSELAATVRLPLFPLASLTSLTAYSRGGTSSTIPTTGCAVWGDILDLSDAALDAIAAADPRDHDALRVEVVAGHGHAATTPCPPAILLGLRELIAYWHQHRGEGFSLIRGVAQDVGAGGGYTVSPPVPRWVLQRLANFYHRR